MSVKHGACDRFCQHDTPEDRADRAAFQFFATMHEAELRKLAEEPLSCSGYRRFSTILLALPDDGDRLFLARVLRRLVTLEDEKEVHTAIVEKVQEELAEERWLKAPTKQEITH